MRKENGKKKPSRRMRATAVGPEERHRFAQLMISGTLFVALVAVKILLPDRYGPVREAASGILEQNMDVMAVFSAVGRAFVEERDFLDSVDSVYQAVFRPDSAVEASGKTGENVGAINQTQTGGGLCEPVSEVAEAADILDILYSGENIPENVELQQVVLGVDYCAPLKEGKLSSSFGYRRDPVESDERFHYGLDITAAEGTGIAAFADGRVAVVGESSSYGKYMIIDHAEGIRTLYAHCCAIHVAEGQAVTKGAIVAQVGDTGQATGAHLHFELHREGVYLNPIYYVV